MKLEKFDFIIVGGGIIGLTIAKAIFEKNPASTICILEKESSLGVHGSGRNSGVLHSGIYYPENSLKGQLCAQGASKMASYCNINGLSINRIGKVILPTGIEDDSQIDLLFSRAKVNGASVSIINLKELKELEPEAFTPTGRALYSPNTSVIDPLAILKNLYTELENLGVKIKCKSIMKDANPDKNTVAVNNGEKYHYGTLINCTGQFTDKIAHLFQVGTDYTMIPFRGSYFKLSEKSNLTINGLIYPVPDLNVPFLGVHSVKTISNDVYFGPTAVPAFGREHYSMLSGIDITDGLSVGFNLALMYMKNNQSFRKYTRDESLRFFKSNFIEAAKKLVPNLKGEDLLKCNKVGIRAQLVNKKQRKLEMDFIVEKNENTIHILNAVSPAFTSSFAIAEHIVNNYID